MTIEQRVERLEKKAVNKCPKVIVMYEGETEKEALARCGLSDDTDELIILAVRFLSPEAK